MPCRNQLLQLPDNGISKFSGLNTLSENSLKQIALQYLKRYYREYPRVGEIKTSTDLRGEGGIIADGMLTFPREDGTWFVATVEATSYETKNEVKYLNPLGKIAWDAIVIAMIVPAVYFYWKYKQDPLLLLHDGNLFWGVQLSVIAASLGLLYLLVFRKAKRYRYIYAVAQFRQYHADHQWIAVGEDVFPHKEDKYFSELQNQCIRNGIGLIQIQSNGVINLCFSPANFSVFSKRRKAIYLQPLQGLMKRFENMPVMTKMPGVELSKYLLKGNAANLLRFKGAFRVQKYLSLLAFISIIWIFLAHNLQRSEINVNEKVYANDLQAALKRYQPESTALDTVVASWIIPVYTKIKPYLDVRENLTMEWVLPKVLLENNNWKPDNIDKTAYSLYDCSALAAWEAPHYLLQFNRYFPLEFALEQAKVLNELNIKVNCLWLGCLSERTGSFLVAADKVYSNPADALKGLETIRKKLGDLGVDASVEMIEIRPDKTL